MKISTICSSPYKNRPDHDLHYLKKYHKDQILVGHPVSLHDVPEHVLIVCVWSTSSQVLRPSTRTCCQNTEYEYKCIHVLLFCVRRLEFKLIFSVEAYVEDYLCFYYISISRMTVGDMFCACPPSFSRLNIRNA